MTEKNSGPEKPTDESIESPDAETEVDSEREDSADPTSLTSVEADLGASALVELDIVDIDEATIITRTLTIDEEPFRTELGVTVGPVHTEAVLDAESTAALATELTDAVDTLRERGAL